MRRFLALTILSITTSHFLMAQENNYNVPKIEDLVKIPPSPEAQAFIKYGNIPVNLYSGSPDISIPLHSIQGREISVPITLTYDASGVKVDQIATWVGLNWNLNVGGMVTRQVRGNPDDYLTSNPSIFPFYSNSIASDYNFVKGFTAMENSHYNPGELTRYFQFLQKITNTAPATQYEIQPDLYSFNVLGLSGTMYIDYATETAYCMEHPEIKAVPHIYNSGAIPIKQIIGWTITDANGNTYYFELPERTYVYEENEYDHYKDYYSSWMLTKIETTNKRDQILFQYSTLTQWQQPQLAGRGDFRIDFVTASNCGVDQQIITPVPLYKISQYELQSIMVNGRLGASLETSSSERIDLAGRKALTGLKVYNTNGSQIRDYRFIQSYFGTPDPGNDYQSRLKLERLEAYGDQTSTEPQVYSFEYFPGEIPSRDSFAQDFWGYYNGVQNTTLIPYNYDFDKEGIFFSGGNRYPNLSLAKIGTLSKITYPTGGSSEFIYGGHKSFETTYSYKEEYTAGAAGLIGGEDPADPFGYLVCDPGGVTNIPPKGVNQFFQVDEGGGFTASITMTGTPSSGAHMQFLALYRAGEGARPLGRTFCDLFNNNPPEPLIRLNAFSPSQETIISLEPGFYGIMILNTDPNLTISVSVTGTRIISKNDVGGLRIESINDIDFDGSIKAKRYFYYGDLSLVDPQTINEEFILYNNNLNTGLLHAKVNYEEIKLVEKYSQEPGGSFPDLVQCGPTYRYSNNRTQSNLHITYPVVSEIRFSAINPGIFAGYSVTSFHNEEDNYVVAYQKGTTLNGRQIEKRDYDATGSLLRMERDFYSQFSVGGEIGFVFYSNTQTTKDIYVKSELATPENEFFVYEDPVFVYNGTNWQENHCSKNGIGCVPFIDDNYHDSGNWHPFDDICEGDAPGINKSHDAWIYYTSLSGSPELSITHYKTSGLVTVCRQLYEIHYCKYFGSVYDKITYLFPRYWAKLDSAIISQYSGQEFLTSTTRNFYENSNHYQVTRVEQKDSKSVLHKTQFFYPHEMQILEPSNTIWPAFVTSNRISQPIQIKATFGNDQPDFLQKTEYKSIAAGSNTMYVSDIMKFSSGSGPLESRVRYHEYDNVGNPIEISGEDNMHISYRWGYNLMFPVVEVKNAFANEFFFTSFEAGEYGGNSNNKDSYTGLKSKTDGFVQELTGLTPNKPYVLTYWQKSGSSWSLQTMNIAASASTSYTINLSGQVDEVRFCPQGSLMTTYTYNPGAGVTTITDANNQVIFYEYDNLGRMWLVKDSNFNIIRKHLYNYYEGQ